MSIELVLFSIAVILLVLIRNWEKVGGGVTTAGGILSGSTQGLFGWLTGIGGVVSLLLLWGALLLAVALGNPKAWGIWTHDWGYFAATQIVAIALIVFAVKGGWEKFAGGILAVGLALSLLYSPEQSKTSEKNVISVAPLPGKIVKKITVKPGEWGVVAVPDHYTAVYGCSDWGNVQIPGSRVRDKGCGPRASMPDDDWGTLYIKNGLRLIFTPAVNRPIVVTVTMLKAE